MANDLNRSIKLYIDGSEATNKIDLVKESISRLEDKLKSLTGKEVDYAKKLLHYCQENNFNICGDYICEVLSELSIFDHNERSMFLRLQVPVSFNK